VVLLREVCGGLETQKKGTNSAEGVQGWDWAGVTGEWRRAICWLDYQDLLSHNMSSHFYHHDLPEITRIFPMTLRIAGYSKSRTPPLASPTSPAAGSASSSSGTCAALPDSSSLIWKLPIIHVEGESVGSDTDLTSMRRIKGTVSVIGDDAIRWSLASSYDGDSDDPEWITEGVQIGCIGSAMGVLGMWTGAEHARMDPLGPFWAWKVG